jgi:centromeric protein E
MMNNSLSLGSENFGIIPRVVWQLFDMIQQRELEDSRNTYKVHVQFIEIYGEEIRDLLDRTKTSKVAVRELPSGEVFVSGAREEVVTSAEQLMKALDDGSRHRVTASTLMNLSSSRSHGESAYLI